MATVIRDFKGIWIPKEIWLSTDLTLQEKVFLVEIDSLDNEGGCYAGNKYFSDFFGLSKTRVSLVIKSLIEKGYIISEIIYKEGTKQILKRVLKISYRPYLTKVKDPTLEKLKDNNTVNNTISNTKNKKEFFINKKLNNSYLEFIEHRKQLKQPMTDLAITKSINQINKWLDIYTLEEVIGFIDLAITNGWKGIYNKKVPASEKKLAYESKDRSNFSF